jgi:hypothetical protein
MRMGRPEEGDRGPEAQPEPPAARFGGWRRARQLAAAAAQAARRGATRLAAVAGRNRPKPDAGGPPGQRTVDLRSEAELLSRQLLAEGEPAYPPNEANIFALEQAFGERHRR